MTLNNLVLDIRRLYTIEEPEQFISALQQSNFHRPQTKTSIPLTELFIYLIKGRPTDDLLKSCILSYLDYGTFPEQSDSRIAAVNFIRGNINFLLSFIEFKEYFQRNQTAQLTYNPEALTSTEIKIPEGLMEIKGNRLHCLSLAEYSSKLHGMASIPVPLWYGIELTQRLSVDQYVQFILQDGIYVQDMLCAPDQGFFKQSPLHMAIGFDNTNAALAMIVTAKELGVASKIFNSVGSSTIVDNYNTTPLILAIQRGNKQVYKEIIQSNLCDMFIKGKDGLNALDWALIMCDTLAVKLLVDRGVTCCHDYLDNLPKSANRQIYSHFWNYNNLFYQERSCRQDEIHKCRQILNRSQFARVSSKGNADPHVVDVKLCAKYLIFYLDDIYDGAYKSIEVSLNDCAVRQYMMDLGYNFNLPCSKSPLNKYFSNGNQAIMRRISMMLQVQRFMPGILKEPSILEQKMYPRSLLFSFSFDDTSIDMGGTPIPRARNSTRLK